MHPGRLRWEKERERSETAFILFWPDDEGGSNSCKRECNGGREPLPCTRAS